MSKADLHLLKKVIFQLLDSSPTPLRVDQIVAKLRETRGELGEIITNSRVKRILADPRNDSFIMSGSNQYTLTLRLFSGSIFRITPCSFEIEAGLLDLTGANLFIFWPVFFDFTSQNRSIRLITETGKIMKRSIKVTTGDPVESYYIIGLKPWFDAIDFQEGDDILVQAIGSKGVSFRIWKNARAERGEHAISQENYKIAEIAQHVLLHSSDYCEVQPVFMRKIFAIYQHKNRTPPDMLDRILTEDDRFRAFQWIKEADEAVPLPSNRDYQLYSSPSTLTPVGSNQRQRSEEGKILPFRKKLVSD